MGSFMLCYTKLINFISGVLLLFGLLTQSVHAEGISVNKTEIRVSDEGFQLKADFDISLNFSVQQALSHGVAIYFVSEFSLTRSRWYWLDEQLVAGEQTTKLNYNVLTRQYRISRGPLFQSFPTLEEALTVLQRQSSAILAPQLLTAKGTYLAGARLRLDTDQLPKLLQVNALTGRDWNLNSDWYRWVIRPADVALHGEGAR